MKNIKKECALVLGGHVNGYSIVKELYEQGINETVLLKEINRYKNICMNLDISNLKRISRFNYLRFKFPFSQNNLAKNDISRDCSMGYANYLGFRAGTGFTYTHFDPLEDIMYDMEIEPLIMIESNIAQEKGLNLGYTNYFSDYFKKIKSNMRGGQLTFLWHNSKLNSNDEINRYHDIFNS